MSSAARAQAQATSTHRQESCSFKRLSRELHIHPLKRLQGMYMAVSGEPGEPSKLINSFCFKFFWVGGAFGNILIGIVPNSHFGKRRGARDMTIFGSHVASMLAKMYSLIDYFSITGPPNNLQGWFLSFYYCHVDEKSDFVCTTYGGWNF